MNKKFPYYKQLYARDCAAACLRIISKHYNKIIPIELINSALNSSRVGVSVHELAIGAEKLGYKSLSVRISDDQLKQTPLPCILFWNDNHFVVLYKIKKNKYYISDPALGLLSYEKKSFLNKWFGKYSSNQNEGICILLEVTPSLFKNKDGKKNKKYNFEYLRKYFKNDKSFVVQLLLGLVITSLIQATFPYLTQSLVDFGINNQNINFVYLILFAQLFLFIGKTSVELIRDWILIFISTKFKISLISDFIIKLMRFPISFFDAKLTGDILLRIKDIDRIKQFITFSTMNMVFSLLNLIIFSLILLLYNLKIFLIFLVGTILYFIWFKLFLAQRAILDEEIFLEQSRDRSKIIELVTGMQEIQLNNAEYKKRWGWEEIQLGLFNVELRSLKIDQYQNIGTGLLNEVKNIIIIFYSAKLVINGEISLGIMLAIMFIIGQLNPSLISILKFLRNYQDASLSFKRISDFENKNANKEMKTSSHKLDLKFNDFEIKDVSFTYPGKSVKALDGITLKILKNKKTAIVGKSGSGKTTLMKLLLKYYEPQDGEILYGSVNIKNIGNSILRSQIGVVNQEGFLFNDTIANNIVLSDAKLSKEKLKAAVRITNLESFINDLPLGLNTQIGSEGFGISGGEKQRILIARAIYKNPKNFFLDEATSALDTQNEIEIMQNIEESYPGQTKLIIAPCIFHEFVVQPIIVMNKGKIVERGCHKDLIKLKGEYYNLIKNQLELGN